MCSLTAGKNILKNVIFRMYAPTATSNATFYDEHCSQCYYIRRLNSNKSTEFKKNLVICRCTFLAFLSLESNKVSFQRTNIKCVYDCIFVYHMSYKHKHQFMANHETICSDLCSFNAQHFLNCTNTFTQKLPLSHMHTESQRQPRCCEKYTQSRIFMEGMTSTKDNTASLIYIYFPFSFPSDSCWEITYNQTVSDFSIEWKRVTHAHTTQST